jgi:hypothetical protein
MKPVFALLVMAAVLLAACNLPGSSQPTAPTAPVFVDPSAPGAQSAPAATPATVIYMPQQMRDGASVEGPPPVTYFWPDAASLSLVLLPERSYVDNRGFSLELEKPGVSLVLMGGDIASAAWNAAVENGTPVVVRGQQGYIFTPPSGVSLHWVENGNYYLASALGMSAEEVQALLNSLETLNQTDFQKRLTP